ncbi:hypothetical protein [Kordia sp.]|uniref:hypothetical protein n=1 Tax=Kordia sp. TaxID=1965332 RepID=UPI003D291DAA
MYIIWSLINAAFVIFFFALVLSLFTKGKKLFNNKYGNPIIIVLVLGVLGIINAKDKELDNTYVLNGTVTQSDVTKEINTKLEENLSLTFHLSVRFTKDAKGEFVPVSSQSRLDGFISGFQWEYKNIVINKNTDGSFSYEAYGLLHWGLLGIELYTQNKDFEGTFQLEEY